jgi:hypothetical protein
MAELRLVEGQIAKAVGDVKIAGRPKSTVNFEAVVV